MSAFVADWLNLLIRWAHLIAGIGWIGTSFYFIALDLSLKKRERMREGVDGTAWEVHGGGFYHVERYTVAPKELPDDLIWYKWEAYLTWVTGFLLLLTQYYWHATAYLIDPRVLELAPAGAIGISIVSLIVGWFTYDGLCRSSLGKDPVWLAAAVFLLILTASYLYSHVYSGRGALIHVGAFIGTIMAANVLGVIIPNQKRIVEALIKGQSTDPALGAKAKQRSLHNTYLTLPVLLMMVSNHYAFLTNHPHAWILVGLVLVMGACLRYFLVSFEVGEPLAKIGWTLPVIAVALAVAMVMTMPRANRQVAGMKVSDARVTEITHKHCVTCHASKTTHEAFPEAPKGVMLESLQDLRRYAVLIEQQAVQSDAMPLGNETGMTAEERRELGAWLAAQ
ncbi:MAG TPA: urate hydroxylase PuuD [Hyphomicrobiaceae bacterium]|nr:urate hydroxylase PuuD [Hyphomicrobiaceae bacterium]